MLEKLLFHTFVLLTMEFYFQSMWRFVLIVILSGSRIIRELSLWICLWEVILTILTEVWRVSHSGWHHFLRGTLDCVKWRKGTERHPAFIPVSFLTVDVMPPPSHTPDALISPLWRAMPWTGSYNNPHFGFDQSILSQQQEKKLRPELIHWKGLNLCKALTMTIW